MVISFESRFTAVVDADDRFMHFTKCVTAGIGSTFILDELIEGAVFVYWIFWIDLFQVLFLLLRPLRAIYEGAIDLSDLILILHQ